VSRRARLNLTRRLARLEGNRGAGLCICANPIRTAWTRDERNDIEGTCSECGGELIVVLWDFDPREHLADCSCPECTPAAKKKRTQAKAKLEKAAPAIVKAVNPDGTRDWSRLTDEELAEAKDAIKTVAEASAPKQDSSKAWRSKQSREDMSILDIEF
jgi:hypothetical protein